MAAYRMADAAALKPIVTARTAQVRPFDRNTAAGTAFAAAMRAAVLGLNFTDGSVPSVTRTPFRSAFFRPKGLTSRSYLPGKSPSGRPRPSQVRSSFAKGISSMGPPHDLLSVRSSQGESIKEELILNAGVRVRLNLFG